MKIDELASGAGQSIRVARVAQQAQKWRQALEKELVKHQALEPDARAGHLSGAGAATLSPLPVDAAPETAPAALAPELEEHGARPGPPPAIKLNVEPAGWAVDRRFAPGVGNISAGVSGAAPSGNSSAAKSMTAVDRLHRPAIFDPVELSGAHWQVVKQEKGVALIYRGPEIAEGEFIAAASLCRDLLSGQGVRVTRVVNNGRVVFDGADDGATARSEWGDRAIEAADEQMVNRKF